MFALHSDAFFFGKFFEVFVIWAEACFEFAEESNGVGDGFPVCEGTTEPSVIDVVLGATFCGFADSFSGLGFCSNEEEAAVLAGGLGDEFEGFVEERDGLVEVEDMDAVSHTEDVWFHFGVPSSWGVSEVDAGLEELTQIY